MPVLLNVQKIELPDYTHFVVSYLFHFFQYVEELNRLLAQQNVEIDLMFPVEYEQVVFLNPKFIKRPAYFLWTWIKINSNEAII